MAGYHRRQRAGRRQQLLALTSATWQQKTTCGLPAGFRSYPDAFVSRSLVVPATRAGYVRLYKTTGWRGFPSLNPWTKKKHSRTDRTGRPEIVWPPPPRGRVPPAHRHREGSKTRPRRPARNAAAKRHLKRPVAGRQRQQQQRGIGIGPQRCARAAADAEVRVRCACLRLLF